MGLTHIETRIRIDRMKKHASTLPVETILRIAQEAGQSAAADAVTAGRSVAGWKDGKLVKYGPGALPLSLKQREEKRNARVA